MAVAEPAWASANQVDYFNYLFRRDAAGGGESGRLTMDQVTEMYAELRKKGELTVEVLTSRRKICELLYLSAEQALSES